jgi:hypothetical protein
MPLEFSELFHKSELTNNGARFKVPGVYIWGFVYHKDENGIGESVDFSKETPLANPAKHVFIPYYVGESSSSILNRLKGHSDPRRGDASKRTRLTSQYMRIYFNDRNFPLHYKKGNTNDFVDLINYYPNRVIEYFNSAQVLNLIYGNGFVFLQGLPLNQPGNVPINNLIIMPRNVKINDTLDYYINTRNNFFFTYVDIYTLFDFVAQNRCFIGQYASAIIKKFEALTVIMLKGKTLGKFDDVGSVLSSINHCPNQLIFNSMTRSGFEIFKDSHNLLRNPTADYDIDNVAFPGYF